ncbi:hypothetical protein [Streptomyces noursei]|uniref:hypothetical protein n=1 Tax=Streptomyces noursei TaxID=1971 RepID=UPI00382B9A0A
MGKASRRRRQHQQEQGQSRPLALTFCDVDFDRGSRAHGRGVAPAPPEGWVIGRAGLVHAEWNGAELRVTGQELIEGPRPASRLVNALHGKRLVIGHGILTADFRAAAMVTDVPDSLLKRTVDTLAFAHRIRGKRYPTGCGLAALAKANLRDPRAKPAQPSSAPGLRPAGGMHGMSPERGDNDPREDALTVARLWQTMITTRALSWGAGNPSWTHYHGNTRPGTPAGAAALADENIAELTGQQRQIEAVEWAQRVRFEGRVMRPTNTDSVAAMLALHSAKDLPRTPAGPRARRRPPRGWRDPAGPSGQRGPPHRRPVPRPPPEHRRPRAHPQRQETHQTSQGEPRHLSLGSHPSGVDESVLGNPQTRQNHRYR